MYMMISLELKWEKMRAKWDQVLLHGSILYKDKQKHNAWNKESLP